MKVGYLHGDSHLVFSPKRHKHTMFTYEDKGELELVGSTLRYWASVKAYHCPDCNKIEINLNELEES